MGRILAIDYGTKRVGLAVTDELQIIASGLTTVHSKDLIAYLKAYLTKNKVDTIVLGEPKTLQGGATDATEEIEKLYTHLTRTFPLVKIDRIDERFTSKMAAQTLAVSGLKKKVRQRKELLDEVSATIMLQDYLHFKR
ncbi:MAG: Holliday junction resolvase RuvX [Flavobacteriales bacterium]